MAKSGESLIGRETAALRTNATTRAHEVKRTLLAPQAGGVVGHGQAQQQQQEEDGSDDHQLGKFFAGVIDVHEKEGDEGCFDGGDTECDGGVEGAKIERGGKDGESRADQERDENREVPRKRRFRVFR